MKTLLALTVLSSAAFAMGNVDAKADTPKMETPAWMRVQCADENSVNCFDPATRSFVREMPAEPGTDPIPCVFYIDTPEQDYCA